jgi:hypothetical protein
MTEEVIDNDLICYNCKNWVLSQEVDRQEPGYRMIYYTNSMVCMLKHRYVYDRYCEDWAKKDDTENHS